MRALLPGFVLLYLSLLVPAHAATYYVDRGRGDDTRTGLSAAAAWRTLDKANATLAPGDTCLIRGGVHREAWISPARSGEKGKPITYQAYPGETPLLTDGRYGTIVSLDSKSYVTIRGLGIASPKEHDWVVRITGERGVGNRIENCDISDPEGYAPLVIGDKASGNTVVGCSIHDTGHGNEQSGDCIVIHSGAHHNTIARNKLFNGCHSQLLVMEGAHHNTLRDNEMYATKRDWAGAGVNLPRNADANTVVGNRIHDLGFITDQKCAIQIDSAHNVIRGNTIYDVGAFGIALQSYRFGGQKQEATHNLVTENVLYHCGRQPLSVTSKGDCISRDNRVVRNTAVSTSGDWYGATAWMLVFDTYHLDRPAQPGDWFGNVFSGNVLFHQRAGEPAMVLYNYRGGTTAWSIPEIERAYPKSFARNREVRPNLRNPAKGDFRPR